MTQNVGQSRTIPAVDGVPAQGIRNEHDDGGRPGQGRDGYHAVVGKGASPAALSPSPPPLAAPVGRG